MSQEVVDERGQVLHHRGVQARRTTVDLVILVSRKPTKRVLHTLNELWDLPEAIQYDLACL